MVWSTTTVVEDFLAVAGEFLRAALPKDGRPPPGEWPDRGFGSFWRHDGLRILGME
jgi:hypothetical protein